MRTKHAFVIDDETISVLFYNNFATDPNKVESRPQQQPQRERGPERNYDRPLQRRAPPPGYIFFLCRRRDPRQVRSYHDLDAPVGVEIELKYD